MVRKRSFCAGVPLVKLTGTANSHSVQFNILRVPGAIGERSIRAIWESLKCTPGGTFWNFQCFSGMEDART